MSLSVVDGPILTAASVIVAGGAACGYVALGWMLLRQARVWRENAARRRPPTPAELIRREEECKARRARFYAALDRLSAAGTAKEPPVHAAQQAGVFSPGTSSSV